MKKTGILNSNISTLLSNLGHTDQIVIADCGLPIPDNVERIDVAIKQGLPSFLDVLDEVLNDMEVEHMTLANEIKLSNQYIHSHILKRHHGELSYVSHEEFKNLTPNVKAIIRTGEATPYANVILRAGVIF